MSQLWQFFSSLGGANRRWEPPLAWPVPCHSGDWRAFHGCILIFTIHFGRQPVNSCSCSTIYDHFEQGFWLISLLFYGFWVVIRRWLWVWHSSSDVPQIACWYYADILCSSQFWPSGAICTVLSKWVLSSSSLFAARKCYRLFTDFCCVLHLWAWGLSSDREYHLQHAVLHHPTQCMLIYITQ